jgi:hypothetical protein
VHSSHRALAQNNCPARLIGLFHRQDQRESQKPKFPRPEVCSERWIKRFGNADITHLSHQKKAASLRALTPTIKLDHLKAFKHKTGGDPIIMHTLVRRLALAIGLLCALAGSQLPEFAQQYRQRLGGAIDELDRMIAQFDADAASQALTRAQGFERLKTNPDALAQERGAAVETDIARAARLTRQREAFAIGGPLTRLASLIENFDPATASKAIRDYELAIPITIAGFVVAGIALVIGWGGTHLCAWPIRRDYVKICFVTAD